MSIFISIFNIQHTNMLKIVDNKESHDLFNKIAMKSKSWKRYMESLLNYLLEKVKRSHKHSKQKVKKLVTKLKFFKMINNKL